jgi:hypothetical protein
MNKNVIGKKNDSHNNEKKTVVFHFKLNNYSHEKILLLYNGEKTCTNDHGQGLIECILIANFILIAYAYND